MTIMPEPAVEMPTVVEDKKGSPQNINAMYGYDQIGMIMAKYDINGNGNFCHNEVRAIVSDIKNLKSANKNLKKAVGFLALLVVLALISIFGVSLAAGEAIKESHVKGDLMLSTTGGTVQTAGAVVHASIWDLPALAPAKLATIKTLEMAVDMRETEMIGAWVMSAFKVAAIYKKSNDIAFVKTSDGGLVTLNRATKSGTILMPAGEPHNGKTYTVDSKLPAAVARSLKDTVDVKLFRPHERRLWEEDFSFTMDDQPSGSGDMMSGYYSP